jgi:hypothetical protein
MGEGTGILVIEEREHAIRRGAKRASSFEVGIDGLPHRNGCC